jgi:NTP pyrophosphatase (non-canonical NTP hydrolase)
MCRSHPVAVVHADGQVQNGTLIDATVLVREFPVTLYLAAAEPLTNQRQCRWHRLCDYPLAGAGGCPWDHEQTPQSLRRTLLEETYEAIDALDRGDDASLLEELGDVLLNILMQAEMARQAGRFSMGDVYTQVTAKFIRRHPHVFGDVSAADSEAVLQNWYRIKQSEAGSDTPKVHWQGCRLLPAADGHHGFAQQVKTAWRDHHRTHRSPLAPTNSERSCLIWLRAPCFTISMPKRLCVKSMPVIAAVSMRCLPATSICRVRLRSCGTMPIATHEIVLDMQVALRKPTPVAVPPGKVVRVGVDIWTALSAMPAPRDVAP